ncbi:MAG: phosphate ABC transporter, permease protein PstA [Deltaproteobacteria bacterium RIFCSPLOWO2_02_FULL_44_10]|nr:MAG: phosphate ABC transporter, permease protein PstA [Deltaproteobacteria bacterium RIFCSPHIGHO2_02_FULL_44_16]OGQ47659.1 MAG: phosphate ABC transporter, permease protein PstA [Deltaproteobacteria bacterium RIFCSPLOWO2_02_FULL_44_10]
MISLTIRRKGMNFIMSVFSLIAVIVALIPLVLIFVHLVSKGIGAVNIDFFTQLPKPVGETGGGMVNALVGTSVMVLIACVIALPIGLLGGLYLSEFGNEKFGDIVRFAADMLNGTPSIIMGVFTYAIIVVPLKNFSALAGGVALGIMMLPMVMRTTEEMVRLVPTTLREASLALGVPYWKTLLRIILKTAQAGIITGVLLAIARVAGETAPLLFTALGNQFWNLDIMEPIAALPLQIYTYAISPFEEWHRQAWAGALVLIGGVLLLSLGSRFVFRKKRGSAR